MPSPDAVRLSADQGTILAVRRKQLAAALDQAAVAEAAALELHALLARYAADLADAEAELELLRAEALELTERTTSQQVLLDELAAQVEAISTPRAVPDAERASA